MTYKGKTVQILFLPFPEDVQGKVPGFIMECPACYKIAIDNTNQEQTQQQALGHELAHLFLGHLDTPGQPVMDLEREANRQARKFYQAYMAGELETGAGNIS